MKKILLLCIVVCSAQMTTAQWFGNKSVKGNGEVTTQTFNTSDYDGVAVAGSMDVTLVPGTEGKITVSAESNIMEHLKIEVSSGKLIIGTKNNTSINPKRAIKVTVPVKSIDYASVSGSGEIMSDMTLKSRNFRLKVSGSGDMNLNIETDNLKASVTGSGDMAITGRAENLDASVTGSGDLKATGLKANNVEASVTGSGDVAVYINGGDFKARVTGSGDIRYKGTTRNVDKKVTGSGDIDKM
ncbi:MAG: head GIN domain-containing protein [Nonlabens sp.]|uniref:head GIN domain-containing protein n=1 Tax=Nonlabens sp. TaxID=1888209 RepID=UPI003EFA3281